MGEGRLRRRIAIDVLAVNVAVYARLKCSLTRLCGAR